MRVAHISARDEGGKYYHEAENMLYNIKTKILEK